MALAQAHGTVVGLVNVLGTLDTVAGHAEDLLALCREATGDPLGAKDAAVADYPGSADLKGTWTALVASAEAIFQRCASSSDYRSQVEAFNAADLGFGLAVLSAIAEVEPDLAPEGGRVTVYDNAREAARLLVMTEVLKIANG